ncbi:hypothetical protein CEUSTIGMA_g13164.t1 [Chlamydomonas eustigma]|uniref:Uncharacterized protein n=1 Tax=Chlamydomonas eustigma TaxID=1157962 RepID=A0A250XS28_9CHLO|nr:hypothetical protein CEUSTIGMA_g13164.t1 [Chlamydomonas eustigma]|eukprot:GAX85749.1 hypothetical protein CEUSTIGMA_g13164.t1 [Chlamydomonas eustigma]
MMINCVRSTNIVTIVHRRRCMPINCTNKGYDGRAALTSALFQTSFVASTFFVGVNEAHAEERAWMPRRHFRRFGEQISPDWAAEIAEKEDQTSEQAQKMAQRAKDKLNQQREEDLKKLTLEEQHRKLRADQILSRGETQSTFPASLKLAGIDVFPAVVWGLLAVLGLFFSRSMLQTFGSQSKPKGRWVYDRSLGGKKVFVEDVSGQLPLSPVTNGEIKEFDFDRLASIASAARSSATEVKPFAIPTWWNPSFYLSPGEDEQKKRQDEANLLIQKIEQSKNRGEDYKFEDILLLRAICQEGGVSVRPKTVGGRDAIYRTAVEAVILYAQDRGSSGTLSTTDMASDHPETRLLSALSSDLNMPEERAVGFITSGVASACRARLVEAIKFLKEEDEMGALTALIKLASLVQNLPVLEVSSPEPEMVASSLKDTSTVDERQKIFYLLGQIDIERAALYASLLGFDPNLVVAKLKNDMEAASKM